MGRLPDFLILGASRCGTSSLFMNLLQHPQIEGPSLKSRIRKTPYKEVHFFNRAKRYNYGIEWYKNLFSKVAKDSLCLEASPAYLHEPVIIHRIFKHLPNSKFIILLRNPVDRVISFYSRWITEEQWNPNEIKDSHWHGYSSPYGIVKTGIYVEALQKWLRYFSTDQFLIIKSEDYFKNEKKIIARCFDWLGVELVDIGKPIYFDKRGNKTEWLPYQKEVPSDVKEYLGKFYKPYNLKLYELLSRDFGWQ